MKLSVRKKRVAVSELVGTLIMVAITLVAGAAVFGWVNGQAGNSESAYGQSAANGINYLREHFTPVTYTFTGPGGVACSGGPPKLCTVGNFWVFNNGQLSFTLATLQIQSATGASSFLNIIYTPTGYTAYNSAGTALSCANAPGFTVATPSPLPVSTLTTNPYSTTIPACAGVNDIAVGEGYVITMTGLYGNVVQFQLTANG